MPPPLADLPPPRFATSRAAYLIFVLLGAGVLAPWNIVLNTVAYFKEEYDNTPDALGHHGSVAFFLTAAYTWPQVPVLVLMVWRGDRLSFRLRFLAVLALQTVALAALPLLAPSGLWFSLALVFLLGLTTAVFQSSLYGLASVMPAEHSQGVMLGMGLIGLASTLAQFAVRGVVPGDDLPKLRVSAAVYFAIAAAFMMACAAGAEVLMRMPFTRYHLARAGGDDGAAAASDKRAGGAHAVELGGLLRGADGGGEGESEGGAAADGADEEVTASAPPLRLLALTRAVAVDATSVFLVFTLTFLVFPSVAPFSIKFKGQIGALDDETWWLVLLLLFNAMDTVGRWLCGVLVLFSGRALLAAVVARTLLVVLLIGCARAWAPALGDVAALLVMAAFAASNGYFASLAMMQAPQGVPPRDRERAGALMSFFLQLGILVGSQAAFAFT